MKKTLYIFRGHALGIAFEIMILSLSLSGIAGAAPGDLDASFGTGGKVTTDFGSYTDYAFALAMQSDGKIVVAGYGGCCNFDFALSRYNVDGSLDTTFGTGGKVTTDFGGFVGADYAYAISLQPDGKIVVAGYTFTGDTYTDTDYNFALARYNVDGSLDTTFGTGGKVTTDFGGKDQAYAISLQPDGKIVAAGHISYDFAIVRYNSDGGMDTTFGTGGKVTTDFGGYDIAKALSLQPDGKIVVAGGTGYYDFVIVRYNADGSLDTTFGTGGLVNTDFGSNDEAHALSLQPDGKIVVAGYTLTIAVDNNFALARYNADGSLDTTFGTGGKVTTDFGSYEAANALALQPDGKMVVAGSTYTIAAGNNFALARYNADGNLDTTFGTGGKVTTDFGGNDYVSALALQTDGKIVAAGNTYTIAAGNNFALARYQDEGGTILPETTIISVIDGNNALIVDGSSTLSNSLTLAFAGTSNIGVTSFECSLDSAAYSSCIGPATYSGLAVGSHTFQVRAIDTIGNIDPTPASFTWTILTPAQAIQNTIDIINTMNIPVSVTTSLTSPLSQSVTILTDNNPSNDESACGVLAAFINEINADLKNGKLTQVQANQLLASANAIKASLGC